MVKLGFWQLSRAKEKQSWQQTIENRSEQLPLTVLELENLLLNKNENLTGYSLKINATSISNKLLFLDNQVYKGSVGYLVFQPLQIQGSEKWLLLELGFIQAGLRRNILPKVKEVTDSFELVGRIYQKQANPLSYSLNPEEGWPKRIQNLNFSELAKHLNQSFLPVVIQPNFSVSPTLTDLPHPWQPIPMPAKKHQGYALQWFSMSAALLILLLIFVCNNYKKPTT